MWIIYTFFKDSTDSTTVVINSISENETSKIFFQLPIDAAIFFKKHATVISPWYVQNPSQNTQFTKILRKLGRFQLLIKWTRMVEFNQTLLADLVLAGYQYMVYVGKGDHAVLHPLKEAAPERLLTSMNAWQVEITESEIQEMANGEDVIDFKFYLVESLFNEN